MTNVFLEKTDNESTRSFWIQDAELYIYNTKKHLFLGPVSLMVLKNAHKISVMSACEPKKKKILLTFQRSLNTFCRCHCVLALSTCQQKHSCPNIKFTSFKRNNAQKEHRWFPEMNPFKFSRYTRFRVFVAWHTHSPGPGARVTLMGGGLAPSGTLLSWNIHAQDTLWYQTGEKLIGAPKECSTRNKNCSNGGLLLGMWLRAQTNVLLEKTDTESTSSVCDTRCRVTTLETPKSHLCLGPASLMVLKNAHSYP